MGQTPPVQPGLRHLIDGYGNGGFRIGGETHQGPILVLPDRVVPWETAQLSLEGLAEILALTPPPEILLIGCGERAAMISLELRQRLRAAGIIADAMGTGAACRTYNVLLAEVRRVVAALMPVE